DGNHLLLADKSEYKKDHEAIRQYIKQLIGKPFDLSQDDMLRVHLVKLTEDEHLLVATMHHIASDGWSTSILVREVVEFYNSYIEKRTATLLPLELQYADYAIWQRNYLKGDVLEKKMAYWKKKLEGTPYLEFPIDYKRPAIQSSKGAIMHFAIDKEILDQIKIICQQYDATLFMTLLTAFNVLLHRYSGQEDISVGSATAGRHHQNIEELIGSFLNVVVLRSTVDSGDSFLSLLKQVRTTTLEAYEHQDVPFEKVVESVVKVRDRGRSPLFQVMFILQNTPEVIEMRLGEIQLSLVQYEHQISKFDMTLALTETNHGLEGAVEYSTDLFQEQTIERIIVHFKNLLASIIKEPLQKIGALPMITRREEVQLLKDFNNTNVAYSLNKSIVDLFEEQVAVTPDNVAIVFEKTEVSYKELNKLANRVANYLINLGVQKETLVPICVERGIEMVAGILGILKAGGAYIPLDPEYPEDRIRYMLEDTGATIVLSTKATRSKLQIEKDLVIIEISEVFLAVDPESEENLKPNILSTQLAYVIYTSGSTGKPKGVMIEHRSVVNLLKSISDKVDFKNNSVFLSVTTYSFDISYLELYMPLINGGKLVIAPRETAMNGFKLSAALSYYLPTHVQATPSTWQMLLDSEWENREGIKILIGGEAIKDDIKEQLTGLGNVYNLYGPTETTIWSAFKKLEKGEKVLIGQPIANTRIQIVNPETQLVPVGVIGEICIGGAGLARGYLNREELTFEKFIKNPYSTEQESKIYKTGDLGRWSSDGNIECLGRIDDQVKIRGFRIELGEIETLLLQNNLVRQAVVLAKEDKLGNKRLVGYIVPRGDLDKEAINSYLQGKLPSYMIPVIWVQLDSLPLTPNGKIDKKALADPDMSELLNKEYVAPQTDLEIRIARIWQELLGIERIGVNDNFFELGGHSILAMKLLTAIHKELEIDILLIKDIFQFSTISELSKYLEIQLNTNSLEQDSTEYELMTI
ncbi:MAG: amino acid adenylation domain-containing protein, partial [Bacteroidota bacterium]|nr:amino acid adenylation domain-containing protein [Bacteroidota bacterium]